jgi:hypothetical protein
MVSRRGRWGTGSQDAAAYIAAMLMVGPAGRRRLQLSGGIPKDGRSNGWVGEGAGGREDEVVRIETKFRGSLAVSRVLAPVERTCDPG